MKKQFLLLREYLVSLRKSYEDTPADNIEQLAQRDSLIVVLDEIIDKVDELVETEE